MDIGKSALAIGILGGLAGAAAYMMTPHKSHSELDKGMRKAADELSGVSKELGKAIKSIGETIS